MIRSGEIFPVPAQMSGSFLSLSRRLLFLKNIKFAEWSCTKACQICRWWNSSHQTIGQKVSCLTPKTSCMLISFMRFWQWWEWAKAYYSPIKCIYYFKTPMAKSCMTSIYATVPSLNLFQNFWEVASKDIVT